MVTLLSVPGIVRAAYEGPYPYDVVATTGMVGDLVRNVGGPRANVVDLMGAGVDPHLYTPTRDDVARIMGADVVFYSGLLLEGRMTDTFIKVSRKLPVYPVTELLEESYLFADPQTGHHDPHVWMDAKAWMAATRAVVKSLSEFDPGNKVEYEQRGEAYLTEVAKLDDYARRSFASIPESGRVLVTAHDAFRYMARAYGLEVHGIQGLSTESEAGLQDVNRLIDMIVQRKITAVFVESSVPAKNVRALVEGAKSRGHDLKVGGELFSDAMGPSGTYEGTYLGMIDHNVTVITRALGGTAPATGMQGKLKPSP